MGYEFNILDAVIKVNDVQRKILIPRLDAFFNHNLENKIIAIWGLAFKPETDDIREAPSLYMIEELLKRGAKIKVFDPEAIDNVKQKFGERLYYASSMYDATNAADALIISTEWSIFRTPNFSKLKENMNQTVIFDGRNLYDLDDMVNEGFYYSSIGRKTIK
jgi:UDPglucose 6-dehydrogenase